MKCKRHALGGNGFSSQDFLDLVLHLVNSRAQEHIPYGCFLPDLTRFGTCTVPGDKASQFKIQA